jgi:pyrroline-5-carboxylate reductase
VHLINNIIALLKTIDHSLYNLYSLTGKMNKIGIIGFGNMGGAFARGLVQKNYHVAVTDLREEQRQAAREMGSITVFNTNKELVNNTDIIIIAVKPQDFINLRWQQARSVSSKQFISIMAGKKINSVKEQLSGAKVSRFMPNLAAAYGKSVVGICFEENETEDFKKFCFNIASAVGIPIELPEKLMPAITGLSGSGIAYIFAFIHALALGGVSSGIAYNQSIKIVLETMEGAINIVRKTGQNPVEWLSRVISPAGTTIEGITALEKNSFTYSVMKAVSDAAKRAEELET